MADIIFASQPQSQVVSIETIYRYISNGTVNLNPVYQRNVVWDSKKQRLLLVSLWTNMYIHPVMFNSIVDEKGVSRWICIDGKQRLTSVKLFFDNKLPIAIGEQNVYYKSVPAGIKRARAMTDSEKFMVEQKTLNIVKFDNLDTRSEKHIFSVIQNGVALNKAEKLNAVDTPLMSLARELRDKYYESKMSHVVSDVRCEDILMFARIVMCAAATKGEKDVGSFFKNNQDPVGDEVSKKAHELAARVGELCAGVTGSIQINVLVLVIAKNPTADDATILKIHKDIWEELLRKSSGRVASYWVNDAAKMLAEAKN